MRRSDGARGPRERLRDRGSESLDDAELLALLLRTGTRGRSAEALARDLLGAAGLHGLARAVPAELERQPGVGPTKAATLLAALELGRRLAERRLDSGEAIRGPEDVFRHFHARLRDAPHEQLHLLLLDGRHRLMREVMASRGTLTASLVHPREVFRPALARAPRRWSSSTTIRAAIPRRAPRTARSRGAWSRPGRCSAFQCWITWWWRSAGS